MAGRGKRFVEIGPISQALEDQNERDALVTFFVETILSLDIFRKKIAEQIKVELEKLKIVGPVDSFLSETARNTVILDGVVEFLAKTFDSQWTESQKKD